MINLQNKILKINSKNCTSFGTTYFTLAIMKLRLTQEIVIPFEVSSKNKYFTARFESNVILHKHYLIYTNYWYTIYHPTHYMSVPVAIFQLNNKMKGFFFSVLLFWKC